MLRVILGIVAGFIAWSILWVGSDQVIMMLSPGWYGAHQLGFEKAMTNKSEFTPDNTILIMHLIRAVIITLMSGYLAAFIARGNRNAPLGLGILLLYGALLALQPVIDRTYGLYLTIDPPNLREWALLAVVCAGGIAAGLIPAARAYRLSVADGMTVRA